MSKRVGPIGVLVALILFLFGSVPIGFLLYGGLAAAFGGMLLIGGLMLLQLPLYLLARRWGLLPKSTWGRGRTEEDLEAQI